MSPRAAQAKRLSVAGFDVIEVDVGAPADAPAVVLFHGYGADARDLAPLAVEVPAKKPLRWLFPDAPNLLDEFSGGRMWFPIDVEALQRAQMTGQAYDLSQRVPEGLDELCARCLALFAELKLPSSRLVLGGFSQGAMLATELALRSPEPPRGLSILSGNLINAESWRALAPKRAGLPFFQSHGSADPILSYRGARALEALLKDAGLKGDLLRFENGHAITPEVIEGLARFLDSLP